MAKDPATTPAKKPGRIAQVKQVFLSAKAVDPAIGWWMALAALGVLVVAAVVGIIFSALIYALIIGLPLAFLAATIVLSRRAERAAYKQIEGQPGAVGAALRSIRHSSTRRGRPARRCARARGSRRWTWTGHGRCSTCARPMAWSGTRPGSSSGPTAATRSSPGPRA